MSGPPTWSDDGTAFPARRHRHPALHRPRHQGADRSRREGHLARQALARTGRGRPHAAARPRGRRRRRRHLARRPRRRSSLRPASGAGAAGGDDRRGLAAVAGRARGALRTDDARTRARGRAPDARAQRRRRHRQRARHARAVGRNAEHVVTIGELEGRLTVALIARGAAAIEEDRNLALEPRDTLIFRDARAVAAAPADVAADAIYLYGAMARAAQMAGALESCLTQAVRYATERKQFGKPIGNFQAIQQSLAVLAGHVAASGIAAESAFRAAERNDARFEIAVAKVRVGEAAGVGAGIAHQTHGAIGFTYEHSLHFATRRLWSWRAEFGSENAWARQLGRAVAARGADALWSDLTAR